ncbi:GAF domain-containing protein [Solirubrobacter ginsenosidimutans]|uniref:histidine kinase n=1 Tax=Solirubrobacter ginsenosidimutans TaxID=490573 RepID=A0A9X3N2I4_9ACTN|nr:GAF domain-containing protein [Solirubrobacter ginsenosidimutans]MDA0167097.1 GAF domain-containing protein [Solirubrobacter ginsenosidimutans]
MAEPVSRAPAVEAPDRDISSELTRLADEQAALRRVATLVARQASQADVFAGIAEELGEVLGVHEIRMFRYDAGPTPTAVVVGNWGSRRDDVLPIGDRQPLDGDNVTGLVFRTRRPARLDDYSRASGPLAERLRQADISAGVGTPITVDGRLWGAMTAAVVDGSSLPSDAEARIGAFTEMIGTAIANTAARSEIARLADDQAALRRVATLVAEGTPPAQLFVRITQEVTSLLGHHIDSAIVSYDAPDAATVMAVSGEQPPAGIRLHAKLPVDGSGVIARVLRERMPVRVDDYAGAAGTIAGHVAQHGIRSAVGGPILVQGRLWGALVVAKYDSEPFPPETEHRVSQFTNLVATAIANANARAEVGRLAEQQAALRRVATFVAQGAAPAEVFDAVLKEATQLLGADQVSLVRATSAHEITILALRGTDPEIVRPGARVPLDGDSVTRRVVHTGRSTRLNFTDGQAGSIAAIARRGNIRVSVGAPIVVDGALWGAITASWIDTDHAPFDAEDRLVEFAQLAGSAIANADSRDQLTASRARVLTAGDEARRQVVRDLHDGAQQRLVHTIITLKLARKALVEDSTQVDALLAEACAHAEESHAELRELAHGILPSALTRGGLPAGVKAVVSRLDIPVDADIAIPRLSPEIEASAYFFVAEALTNAVKHAQATRAALTARLDQDTLHVEVRDDGIGGADPTGHGLLGLSDRAAALGGRLYINSPRGAGTVLALDLPLPS